MSGKEARVLAPVGHDLAQRDLYLLPGGARDVGPADATRENEVSDDLVLTDHEGDRPRRVSRRVQDQEGFPGDPQLLAVVEGS